MLVRAYLRASTDEQDASRAHAHLESFAAERGLTIAATYVDNESGAERAHNFFGCCPMHALVTCSWSNRLIASHVWPLLIGKSSTA